MQLSYPELADKVQQYFKRRDNDWRSSAEIYDDAFQDQDKVRFQLVLSNMVLRGAHELVRKDNPNARGFLFRLREVTDPPFVEPVKTPRAARKTVAAKPALPTKPTPDIAPAAAPDEPATTALLVPAAAIPAIPAIPATEAPPESASPVAAQQPEPPPLAESPVAEPERPKLRISRAPPVSKRPDKVVEIGSLAAPAPGPDAPRPSKIAHREIGHVDETPPEVRAAGPDTLPVKHYALEPAPANHLLAAAMHDAFKRPAPRPAAAPTKRRGETVAAFAQQRTLDYEVPPTAKVEQVPLGASGVHGKLKGDRIRLPAFQLNAMMEPEQLPAAEPELVEELVLSPEAAKLYHDKEIDEKAPSSAADKAESRQPAARPEAREEPALASAPAAEVQAPEPAHPAAIPEPVARRTEERRQELKVKHVIETPTPTIGGLLDALLGMAGPAIKNVLRDALIEAITSPQVKEVLHAVPQVHAAASAVAARDALPTAPPDADAPATAEAAPEQAAPSTASAPGPSPQDERRFAPKHKPMMPGDLDEKVRLPKVTVVGLAKPAHEWDIKEQYKKKFDISTVHTDVSSHVVRKYCKYADRVLVVIDHINHRMIHSLQAGGIAFERVSGGVNKVRERLNAMALEYQPETADA